MQVSSTDGRLRALRPFASRPSAGRPLGIAFFAFQIFLLALLLLRGSAAPALAASPSFQIKLPFGTQSDQTQALAVADMNRDGSLDLVVANRQEQSAIYYNNGTGGFQTGLLSCNLPELLRCFGGPAAETVSVAVGDLNGDGYPDLVAGLKTGFAGIYFGSQSGALTYAALPLGGADARVALGDLDGDTDLDLVLGGYHTPSQIALNDGLGSFSASAVLTNTSVSSVALGDMNGDGALDLVFGMIHRRSAIYFNDGAAGFPSLTTFQSGGFSLDTRALALGDLDGDGDLDIAQANHAYGGEFDFGQNYLYWNNGTGGLSSATLWGTDGDRMVSVAIADVDGDGDLDIVGGSDGVDVTYLNNGAGDFYDSPLSNVPCTNPEVRCFGLASQVTLAIAAADMNNDGVLDLVAGNDDRENIIYLNDHLGDLNTRTIIPPYNTYPSDIALGDFDGDGDLDLLQAGRDRNDGDFDDKSWLYFNSGTGVFTSPLELWEATTTSVAAGDLDGDFDLDIVAGNGAQSRIYYNSGSATFPLSGMVGLPNSRTGTLALGDLNDDGYLDILVGMEQKQSAIYLNDGAGGFASGALDCALVAQVRCFGPDSADLNYVALEDIDGDSDLDVIAGYFNRQSVVYLNDGTGSFYSGAISCGNTARLRCFGSGNDMTRGVAAGDLNQDGNIDIVVANDLAEQDMVYFNDGTATFQTGVITCGVTPNVACLGEGGTYSTIVRLADMDGDGDLDIVTGSRYDPNVLYVNNGHSGFTKAYTIGPKGSLGLAALLALGDVNGDGSSDVVAQYTNDGRGYVYLNTISAPARLPNQPPRVTLRRPGATQDAPWHSTSEVLASQAISIPYTLLDPEGEPVRELRAFYSPDGGGRWLPAVPYTGTQTTDLSAAPRHTSSSAPFGWIDATGGTLVSLGDEQISGPITTGFALSLYGRSSSSIWISSNGWLSLEPPSDTAFSNVCLPSANLPHSLIAPFWDDLNPALGGGIYYRRVDPDTFVVQYNQIRRFGGSGQYTFEVILRRDGSITFQYLSLSGTLDSATIGLWQAGSAPAQLLCNQSSALAGQAWSFMRQGQPHTFLWDTAASGFFGDSQNVVLRIEAYGDFAGARRAVAPLFQRPYATAQSLPFRVRGTQVRVIKEGLPVKDAMVYRLPAGMARGAAPLVNSAGKPFLTNSQGYLQGKGQLIPGDSLVALLPITWTQSYTLYHTSAAPTSASLDFYTVSATGVQTLTVAAANPLMLLNLDVSLEWDARNDEVYLAQLNFDFARASEVLYDWSNGQAALGSIRLYHDREKWNEAHIRIYATNRLRPNAAQGGMVSDIVTDTSVISLTYAPGQVRMGATWNRFGDPSSGSLSEDWPRTLAHELGHYALFLDDNYLGLNGTGVLAPVDSCPGAMSDAYSDDTEFHPAQGWLPACERTLSHQSTGRSDWETIASFYPWVNQPSGTIEQINQGPSALPLEVSQLTPILPVTPTSALDVPIFYTLMGGSRVQTGLSARAVLYKDDYMVDLGRPIRDQVLARGAAPGDRLCVYEPAAGRLGCETVVDGDEQLALQPFSGWRPEILITPVTSTTIAISVTNLTPPISPSLSLRARLYPVDFSATAAITLSLQPGGGYSGTFVLADPAMEGYVQVWVEEGPARREALVDYTLGGNPGNVRFRGGNVRFRGGNVRFRGGNVRFRGAPVMSSDGQLVLFGEDLDFPEGSFFTVQTLVSPPAQLGWTTQVGHAYRLSTTDNAPSLAGTSISLSYLGGEVPAGEEQWLTLYHWDGASWRALPTSLDLTHNQASAPAQGPGVYALMSTIPLELPRAGWNLFGYPVQATRPLTSALSSIAGRYTTLYGYVPADSADPWKIYDAAAAAAGDGWVNQLAALEYSKVYWIRVTEPITLLLRGAADLQAETLNPPATFYGRVGSAPGLTPAPGMLVLARVNGVVCGRGTTALLAGKIVYHLDVEAAGNGALAQCGLPGASVSFEVGGVAINDPALWQNDVAHEHDLGLVGSIYLPMLRR